ncbi:MAG: zf-TFIIB domain-containing protein [Desulfomonile tiedjei]|nr:zf-TFIIB domain-containing protein [Desulfomonile tiedjei]
MNVKTFIGDFERGASDQELRGKFSLSSSQLAAIVERLKANGSLADEQFARREENLRIRFGEPKGPPDTEGEQRAVVDPNTGLVLHCPSCGAAVKRGETNCEYCKAALDFNLKGKTVPCPHCFADTPAHGRFCVRCAQPLTGVVRDGQIMDDRLCPRCQVPMQSKTVGEFSLIGCTRCGGFFISSESFEMMQENTKRTILPTNPASRGSVTPDQNVKYVRCPVCRNLMNRTNFAKVSGVIVDTCRVHGIWFDGEELEKVMNFIARGGLQKARAAELEELKAEEQRQKIRNINIGGRVPDESSPWSSAAAGREVIAVADLLHDLYRLFK